MVGLMLINQLKRSSKISDSSQAAYAVPISHSPQRLNEIKRHNMKVSHTTVRLDRNPSKQQ